MKHVLHLVRFDARALRAPLVLWVLILLAEAVQFYLGPLQSGPSTELGRTASQYGFGVLRIAFTCIFTAMLVHKDPTVGTTPFWKARPVNGAVLLVSKVLSGVLWFVLLPAGVTAGVLVVLGMGMGDALLGGWVTTQMQIAVFIAALAVSSITANLLHFAIGALGALALVSLAGGACGPWLKSTWPAFKIPITSEMWSWMLPAGLVILAVVTAYQYLTLRIWRTASALAAVTVVGSLLASLMTITYVNTTWRDSRKVSAGDIAPSALTISADTATQLLEDSSILEKPRGTRVTMRYSVTDIGPDIIIEPFSIDSEIEFPDGSRFTWSGGGTYPRGLEQVKRTANDQPYRAIAAALGTRVFSVRSAAARVDRICVALIPQDKFVHFKGQVVRVRSTVLSRAYRFTFGGAVPFKTGSVLWMRPGMVEAIERITTTDPLITVDLRRTVVRVPAFYGPYYGSDPYLRNPIRREAVYGMYGFRGRAFWSIAPAFSGIGSERFQVTYQQSSRPIEGVRVDAAWLADAEWARVDTQFLGIIARPLKIDSFVLGETQK